MEVLLFWLVLLCLPVILVGGAGMIHTIGRALESPQQRAERERKEAEEKAKAAAEAAEREAHWQRQRREYELNAMREKWELYQNVFRANALNDLTSEQFELLVADFFRAKGYSVEVVGQVGDFGVDLIAKKGSEVMAVQVKRYTNNVGPSAIQQAHSGGHFKGCNCFSVVTSSYFTDAAKLMAERLSVKLYWRSHIGKHLEGKGIGTRREFSEAEYLANKQTIDELWDSMQWRHPRKFRQHQRYRRYRNRY